jgi:hypothetical protein
LPRASRALAGERLHPCGQKGRAAAAGTVV